MEREFSESASQRVRDFQGAAPEKISTLTHDAVNEPFEVIYGADLQVGALDELDAIRVNIKEGAPLLPFGGAGQVGELTDGACTDNPQTKWVRHPRALLPLADVPGDELSR